MPKISVVLAAYNGKKFICEQLDSLLCQTRQADEVIISDDCSSDGTDKIITEYIKEHQLKNWCFYSETENVGFIRNFRNALQRSTGDIILLCDQDDIWHGDKLEKIEKFFVAHPDMRILATALNAVDENGKPLSRSYPEGTVNCGLVRAKLAAGECRKISLPEVMRCNVTAGCAMAVSRETVRLYCEKSVCEIPHDQELNMLAAANAGLYFCNSELTDYRIHTGNAIGFRERVQSRTDIAKEKLLFAGALDRYLEKPLSPVFKKRADALHNRRFFEAVLLNFCRDYRKFYNPRERAGDLKYCVKGE